MLRRILDRVGIDRWGEDLEMEMIDDGDGFLEYFEMGKWRDLGGYLG